MKVRFNRQEMADALSAVCAVAASRTPKPILQCVRLDLQTDALFLSATDLEHSIRCAVTQVEVEEAGEAVVVADTLAKIVRECQDELLRIEVADNHLHVRGEGSHFRIVTSDPAEFPPVAAIEGDPDLTVECGVLRRLIDWTHFACARESTRYAINGVLWTVEDGHLVLVATDGRRLSWARGAFEPARNDLTLGAIVPVRSLQLLNRVPIEADATVAVRISSNQVVIQAGAVTIGSSLVEGHFPKYQDVIPTDNDKRVVLNTAALEGALKRARLLTNEESKGVRLAFTEGTLTLSSRAPEQGEATITLPIEHGDEPFEIGFNPTFILDVLKVVDTDEVSFAFKEPTRPGVFSPNRDFLYVVMPVSLT